MDVINQMLHDLEKQKRQAAQATGFPATGGQTARGSIARGLWLVIVVLFLIALLVWGLFKTGHLAVPAMINGLMHMPPPEMAQKESKPAPSASMSQPAASAFVPVSPPLMVPEKAPMVMQSIDWQINKQAMAMSFRLPSKIQYEVVVDEKKNVVTLTFPHTVLDGSKPLIMLENEFADKLEKIQDGDFLQVKAYLKPNTAVAYVDYAPDSKLPTLVMSLSRTAPKVNQQSTQ